MDRSYRQFSKALLLGLLAISPQVLAEQSVEIGDQIFTCTTRCNVSYSGGYYHVTDCCGGRVKMQRIA
jgi:hypothetical protein